MLQVRGIFPFVIFFTKTNYNSWHSEGHAEKWWCISHSQLLIYISFIYTHPRISEHEWVSYWQSLTDCFSVSQFLKIRICLSGITNKYPLSSILNYSKLCLTQYQVYRFTKHTVSAKIWQKCKSLNIFNSSLGVKVLYPSPPETQERLPYVLLFWFGIFLAAVPWVLCDLPVSPHFLALFYANWFCNNIVPLRAVPQTTRRANFT